MEKNRYYKFNDPEVRGGQARKGDIRQGHHMHVQVIMSAKTADQQLAISPHSTELSGSIGKIKNNQVYKGFSRNQFKEGSEKAFDEMTGYPREISDSFAYHKTMKTGTLMEKEAMQQSAGQERRQQAGAERVGAEQQPEQTPVTGVESLAMPEIRPLKTEFEKAPAQQQKNQQNEQEQNREQQRRRGPRL
ncbi:DUF5712 family protein [Mucilaginibacter antarcticus]|uniref:DUF5712 family protein n=1 Tax=Mucilaginibacter antarcticus TaxID=1855725 RepID=UPI00363DFC8E